MPLIRSSSYSPSFCFPGGHAQTIIPAAFRKPAPLSIQRIRINTPDQDFLDLDYHTDSKSDKVAIISHGLEGSSRQPYVQGMARSLSTAGWDTMAWNFRGCSDQPNRLLRFYHSGATEDLQAVIDHVSQNDRYIKIALIGFSLGGNLTLKYLGDLSAALDPRIYKAVTFSVPCDLESCSYQLASPANRFYMWRFMRSLKAKIQNKAQTFPGTLDISELRQMRTFADFDDRYTAPIHGFDGAIDYWTRCSCKSVLPQIKIPSLLVNARNDPFLAPACYPEIEATDHRYFHFEAPDQGGHVGFMYSRPNGDYWSETRTIDFLDEREASIRKMEPANGLEPLTC